MGIRLDRRQLLSAAAGAVLGGLALPARGLAAQAGPAPQPDVLPLTDRLWLVTTGGTNVLALQSPDGLVLVDAGAPDRTERLLASLRALPSGDRVRTVFNTHWHAEHTGANARLRQAGAAIVAHVNTRLWMATPVWVPAEDRYRDPRPPAALPTDTFYTGGTTTAGRERIDYGYLIEAHTSGDCYVFFRDANVVAAGDVVSPVRDPALDWFTGAWLGGRVDALDRLLALGDDDTRFVPGFGPVVTRAGVRAERDMLAAVYERVVERVRQGDSVEDMLEAGVLSGTGRRWDDPLTFLQAVHKGLWAHHNKLAPDVV